MRADPIPTHKTVVRGGNLEAHRLNITVGPFRDTCSVNWGSATTVDCGHKLVFAMSHEHGLVRPGTQYRRRLTVTLAMVLGFMVVEVVTAVITGSLSLLSDAGHMAADGLGLAMALAAMVAADRAGIGDHRTFGLYRLEILAALANAVLLFGVAVYVLWEAARRFSDPTEVLSGPMLIVAILGLVVNLIAWRLLRPGATASLNLEGASLEVLADLVGSIGVIPPPSSPASPTGPTPTRSLLPPSASSSSPEHGDWDGERFGFWSKRHQRAWTWERCASISSRSRESSTSTTSMCGPSPPTCRWPRSTSWSPMAPILILCSTRRAACYPTGTGSRTPRSRSSRIPTSAAPRSPGSRFKRTSTSSPATGCMSVT